MDSPKLLEKIGNGHYDTVFSSIYGGEEPTFHRKRWMDLIQAHRRRTGVEHPRLFSAPGRTELAGNHTDHNRGRVLAASVQLDTIAAVSETRDAVVELVSEGYPPVLVDLSSLDKVSSESGTTDALVRGIAASFVQRGGQIGGFRASTTSRVLKGSGLSSSAALEVLVGSIYNTLFNKGRFTPLELALMGQEAENHFFGKPSGLMDQTACAVGGVVAIDFADPKNPVVETINADFNAAGYTLAVVDSRADHADLTPDYAAIPKEMRSVAKEFGATELREVQEEAFYAALPNIRARTGDRAILRSLHFYNENRRVEAMVSALERDDIADYIEGVRRSGDSSFRFLQNIYPSQTPREQSVSLALALSERFLGDDGAARVHGGGFAGTIQVFIPTARFPDYMNFMGKFFGTDCVVPLSVRKMPVGELKPDT